MPPFGDEMNKSRRQFTETCQELAARGYATLIVDVFGTGDSEGDFADASWDVWKGDIAAAIQWLETKHLVLYGVVGTRLGCALAADSLRAAGCRVQRTAFWQPVDSGRRFMAQFLRVRVAASMMQLDLRETVESLTDRLESGETLEVGGYDLPPGLWRTINKMHLLSLMDSNLGDVGLFEIGRGRGGELSAGCSRLLKEAASLGLKAEAWRITGETFWNSTEIVVSPELTRQTAAFLT